MKISWATLSRNALKAAVAPGKAMKELPETLSYNYATVFSLVFLFGFVRALFYAALGAQQFAGYSGGLVFCHCLASGIAFGLSSIVFWVFASTFYYLFNTHADQVHRFRQAGVAAFYWSALAAITLPFDLIHFLGVPVVGGTAGVELHASLFALFFIGLAQSYYFLKHHSGVSKSQAIASALALNVLLGAWTELVVLFSNAFELKYLASQAFINPSALAPWYFGLKVAGVGHYEVGQFSVAALALAVFVEKNLRKSVASLAVFFVFVFLWLI
jgi:hypothetical protein